MRIGQLYNMIMEELFTKVKCILRQQKYLNRKFICVRSVRQENPLLRIFPPNERSLNQVHKRRSNYNYMIFDSHG